MFISIDEATVQDSDMESEYTCTASGFPLPTISWTVATPNNGTMRRSISNAVAGVTITVITMIPEVQSRVTFADNVDFEEVECTASNNAGTMSTRSFVLVLGTTESTTSGIAGTSESIILVRLPGLS